MNTHDMRAQRQLDAKLLVKRRNPTPKLKPCPWCGGAVQVHHAPVVRVMQVRCNSCRRLGPLAVGESAAIRAWNTRKEKR